MEYRVTINIAHEVEADSVIEAIDKTIAEIGDEHVQVQRLSASKEWEAV
jgi:hypothetical protein